MMNRNFATFIVCLSISASVLGQTIKVNPTGVNVNLSGATTVFLTYGRLVNYRPAEAYWCGDLIPAAPDLGMKCDPSTVFGGLPARYDLSRPSGDQGFTDIMSIPPSVARRAFQSAASGDEGRFFYVRRFISVAGGPDQYVAVTCRLAGGGARAPLALTDVKLVFTPGQSIVFVKSGATPPPISAEIKYNGSGRLIGRWEVVMPGEDPPTDPDLLTEATLPVERRSLQKRYTQLSRFNVFLPPTGRITMPGPDPARLPQTLEGPYLVLLRIEASDDKEADSDLTAVGVGPGVVHSGAVAGFALPVLQYFVGVESAPVAGQITLLSPKNNATLPTGQPIEFTWSEIQGSVARLEINDAAGQQILSALLPPDVRFYRAPPWLREKLAGGVEIRWRVVGCDPSGRETGGALWNSLRLEP
jgi:hypothetical protein